VLPAARDVDRDCAHVVALAAHPAHDVLREADPDLLVVVELWMVLEVQDGSGPRLCVARRVELETVVDTRRPVALRPQQRAGLGEREVDVEENGAQARHTWVGHRYAAGRRFASEGSSLRIRSRSGRESSAEITVSSSEAAAKTMPHGSTIMERP
jgi:hypothetical protein